MITPELSTFDTVHQTKLKWPNDTYPFGLVHEGDDILVMASLYKDNCIEFYNNLINKYPHHQKFKELKLIERVIPVITDNNNCPKCGHPVEINTSTTGTHEIPKKGDISICVYCSSICVYNEDLTIHLATQEEINEFKKDSDLWNLVGKIIGDIDKVYN